MFRVGGLLMRNGVIQFTGTAAPVNGAAGTGFGVAGPGSLYFRTDGAVYANTNTKASPTWTQLGSVAALADGKIFVGGAGGAAAAQTPSGDLTMSNTGVVSLAETLVKYAEIAIPSADIVSAVAGKLSHAQGQVLVAAPGAGKALELLSAVLIYDFAGAGYGGGGNLTISWGAGGAALTGLISAANSLGSAADKVIAFVPLSTAGISLVSNAALHLVSSAVPWTLGAATGVARVKVAYRVHTTGL